MSSFSESLWSNVAAVLVASLCLGFFGLLYTKSIQYDELSDRVVALERSNDRFRFVAAQEIALLKTTPEQTTPQVKVLEPLVPTQPEEELVEPVLELPTPDTTEPPKAVVIPDPPRPEPPVHIINKSSVPRSEDDFRTEQRRLQKDFGVDRR